MAFQYKANLVINAGSEQRLFIPTSEHSVLDLEWSIEDAQDVEFALTFEPADALGGEKRDILPSARLHKRQQADSKIEVSGAGICVLTWNNCYGGWLGGSTLKLTYSAQLESKQAVLEEQQRLERQAEEERKLQEHLQALAKERRRREQRDARILELNSSAESLSESAAELRRSCADNKAEADFVREKVQSMQQEMKVDSAKLENLLRTMGGCQSELAELIAERDADVVEDTASSCQEDDVAEDASISCRDADVAEEYDTVVLDKREGGSLGIDVQSNDDNTRLVVLSVTGGLVGKWNVANPTHVVAVGSSIFEVNGVRGSSEQLMAQCKKNIILDVKVATQDIPEAVSKHSANPTPVTEQAATGTPSSASSPKANGYPKGGSPTANGSPTASSPSRSVTVPVEENKASKDDTPIAEAATTHGETNKLNTSSTSTIQANGEPKSPHSASPASPAARDNEEVRIVRLDKSEGGSLGAKLDFSNGTYLLIKEVIGGLLASWNNANPSTPLRHGCRIVTVNGVSGDSNALLEECKKPQVLELTVVWPAKQQDHVTVTLDKTTGGGLGISLDISTATGATITSIDGGLVGAWNEAHPERVIKPGCRILKANGVSGDVNAILAECKKDALLEITFLQPQPPALPNEDQEIRVIIDKTSGGLLGATLDFSDNQNLIIKSVDGGLLGTWNETQPHQIKAWSRIISVNGVTGLPMQLLEELKKNQKLDIRMAHGAAPQEQATSPSSRATPAKNASAEAATDGLDERDLQYPNGASYKGQCLGESYHGRGRLIRSDGASYDGEFEQGKAHGQGRFCSASGHVYDGQWTEDLADGDGSYDDGSGLTYSGQWRGNEKCGRGVQRWEDGSSYEGQFQTGRKHGEGSYTAKDGRLVYKGEFHNDKMHGHGTHMYNDGRVYVGQWRAGLNYGEGVMEWPDGSKYAGGFMGGRRHGAGTLSWADGRQYKGQWLSGKQHGIIVATDVEGVETEMRFQNGALVTEDADAPAEGDQ